MKISIKNKFGGRTLGGNRHFPLLYFAYGTDGFIVTVLGMQLMISPGKK